MQKFYDRVIGVEKVLWTAGCVTVAAGVSRDQTTQQVPPHSRPQHIHHQQLCSHPVTLLHTDRWHRGLINTFEGHGGAKVEEYSLVVTLTTFRHSSQDRGISEIVNIVYKYNAGPDELYIFSVQRASNPPDP